MDNHTPSPQYAIGAEREVIGALFNLGGDVDFVENIFTKITDPSFFSDGVTRQTYEVASELFKAGKIINESTLSDILFDQGSQDLYVSLTDIIDKTTGSRSKLRILLSLKNSFAHLCACFFTTA